MLFLNALEFNNFSTSRAIVSVSENGANPTPNEVSLDDGAPLRPKTSTKSPEP